MSHLQRHPRGLPDPFGGPTAEAHTFRFVYEGAPRPLKPYLIERFRFGRSRAWAERFYPATVRLNEAPVDERTALRPGDRIAYRHHRADEPAAAGPAPEVLYEDEWTLALFKPDSVPVNPSGAYYFTSLAIAAREQFGNPELTPVHRLDLETSGPLIFAKSARDIRRFHALFLARAIRKRYLALVHGHVPEALREIRGALLPDGASAITSRLRLAPEHEGLPSLSRVVRAIHHRDAASGRAFSELELEPVTGKTNQLRVHLAAVGHAIVGDKKYHPDERVFLAWYAHRDFEPLRGELLLPRQALMCRELAFAHPVTGQSVRIAAPAGRWSEKLGGLISPALADTGAP
ncbi:MAG: RluA family pseudouridine synthase [Candidatus Lambdaproteobacteria bacterium]|nr:RluA family pseudouridine synthase [Candidatus Lambdaproteobacteria bacterium]